MQKPVFKYFSGKNGEIIFLWTNPPGNDAEFTFGDLCDLGEALRIESIRSTNKREVMRC